MNTTPDPNASPRPVPPLPESLPLPRRLLRLGIALAVFWFIVFVLAPLPIEHFGPMRKYSEVVDRTGITPGALFYNDVPQSLDAETNNRDAIRFIVNKDKGE